MASNDPFWIAVDEFLAEARTARTAREIIDMANARWTPSAGQAFFPGSGGDAQLLDALDDAHWTFTNIEADYYWTARGADGQELEYVEGDLSIK